MKKSLLLSAALLSMTVISASASLPSSNVPAGITVQPQPSSTIDISPNAFPLGASAISLTFTSDVDKNTNNERPALLYYNDFTTPVSSTLATSIDMVTWKSAGVLFSDKWTKNGLYKIEIPEGMFFVGGSPNPALELYYEIDVPWYSNPVDKMVLTELGEVVLTFPDVESVKKTDKFKVEFGTLTETMGCYSEIEDNKLIFRMDQGGISSAITNPGQYLLTVQAESIEYVKNGETRMCDEIRLTFFISAAPEPDIWPYCDEVQDGIEYFELELNPGFKTAAEGSFLLANDRAINYLYPADEYGNIDTKAPVAIAKVMYAESDLDNRRIYLGLFNPDNYEEPLNFEIDKHDSFYTSDWTVVPGTLKAWKPEVSGSYCLLLSQGLYSGNYQSIVAGSSESFITSDPYRFYYDIMGNITGVEDVEIAEKATVDAYTLTGLQVLKGASKDAVKNLPAGFYVVNGKKVIIK